MPHPLPLSADLLNFDAYSTERLPLPSKPGKGLIYALVQVFRKTPRRPAPTRAHVLDEEPMCWTKNGQPCKITAIFGGDLAQLPGANELADPTNWPNRRTGRTDELVNRTSWLDRPI
jgi:hypothetical protein